MKQKKGLVQRGISALLLLCLTALSFAHGAEKQAPSIKTLIVTGQNYHPWEITSAVLKKVLENTGLFRVDIAVSPPAKSPMKEFRPDFSAYQLVVLDYSGDAWPSSTQKAFVSYVKNGGGVVVYHSASTAFPEWPEYNEIIGLGGFGGRTEEAGHYVYWKNGKVIREAGPGVCGYHGPEHSFLVVNRDPSHPITAGLPERWMHASDELYGLLRGPAKNITVLSTAFFAPEQSGTGRDEPVLFTVNYGAGRIFHTVLGHARPKAPHPALECVGFITTFQRGAEWAATGKVTQKVPADFPATDRDMPTPEDVRLWTGYEPPSLDRILKDLDLFEYSRSEEVLYRLRDYVINHRQSEEARAEMEEKLLNFLAASNNPAARLAVCRQLRLIGSEKSVPVLEPMLLQDETTDMARYALEKIPARAVDKALSGALNNLRGNSKLGVISSLGQRKTQDAIDPLAALLADQDPAVASATATALGRIGGKKAAAALSDAFDKAQGAFKADLASGLLVCAEEFVSSGDASLAGGIFDKILSLRPTALPTALRQAAFKGRIAAATKDAASRMILEALTNGPQEILEPAIGLLPGVFKESEIAPVLELLPKLPEPSQVQLIAVLAEYPKDIVRPAIMAAAKNFSPEVRIEALRALSKVGDPPTVPFLAERAASSKGEEQRSARESLWSLQGREADEAVMFWLVASSDEPVKNELIRAAGERRIFLAKKILMSLASSATASNSLEASKALRALASPEDIPDLLEILLVMADETAQGEMENTIGALAQRISDPYARAKNVKILLAPAPESKLVPVTDRAKRCRLYKTLGKIGDDSSLPLLRAALRDPDSSVRDAAVRALSEWPNPTPREDLLDLARKSTEATHQVLALRGFVRMVGLEKHQLPEAAVRHLGAALELAARPEEKRLVLGALPDFACPEALALAESLLTVEEVREEAQAAVDKIRERVERLN